MNGETYKILIADDEYWSREKIIRMIDWKEYGLKLLKPAENGEEVLKRLEEEVPDILITDINMPFIDGVELIRILKEKYPEVIVFVISGYDDFQYVKSTMKSGAINYLLKPVSRVDLINAVSEAMDILYEKKKAVQMEEEKQKKLLMASSWLKDREFSHLVDNKDMVYSAGVSMEINLDITGYTLMLIKLHDLSDLPEEFTKDMQSFSYFLKKKIQEKMGDGTDRIFNHISKPNEFMVISNQDNQFLYKKAVCCMKMLEEQLHSPVTVVLSDHNYTMENIYTAYVQDISLLMSRKYNRESVVIVYNREEEKQQKERIEHVFDSILENQLISLLEHGNRKQVKSLILKTLCSEKKELSSTYLEIKQTLKQANNILLRFYGKEADSKDIIDMENMNDYVEQSVERLNLEMVCELEEDFIDTVMQMHASTDMDSMKAIAEQIRQYINEHFSEELTLSGLASKYGVEKSYLSRIFRQETGKNLMPYIAEKRIERGKELIRENSLSLTEISYLVGYDDYTYFNRVFRKIEGISPSEYRNVYQEKKGYEG